MSRPRVHSKDLSDPKNLGHPSYTLLLCITLYYFILKVMVVPMGIHSENAAGAATSAGNGAQRTLTGYKGFTRSNPMSDRFNVKKFDHVEFWCGDAVNTSRRYGAFGWLWVEQVEADVSHGL